MNLLKILFLFVLFMMPAQKLNAELNMVGTLSFSLATTVFALLTADSIHSAWKKKVTITKKNNEKSEDGPEQEKSVKEQWRSIEYEYRVKDSMLYGFLTLLSATCLAIHLYKNVLGK